MTYKHKLRVSHIQDDLERGYIKTKDEYKQALSQLDKETLIEYFLEEFDSMKEQDTPDIDNSDDGEGSNVEF